MATRLGPDADNGRVVKLLQLGLRALWDRAEPSLGGITLAAIVQRAIHTAERSHEELVPLGLHVTERGAVEIASPSVPRVDLTQGVASVLSEVLRALGSLTANALTPGLHAALQNANANDEPRRFERDSAVTRVEQADS